jgi:hypothetical protein
MICSLGMLSLQTRWISQGAHTKEVRTETMQCLAVHARFVQTMIKTQLKPVWSQYQPFITARQACLQLFSY